MGTNGTAATTGDLLYVPSGVARLNYFYGQLLTQRDLKAEQRYGVMLRRMMARETFGTGTVAGLRVDPAPSAAVSVLVRAGLAMDPDGRELLLANDVSVTVADPEETAPPTRPVAPVPRVVADGSSGGRTVGLPRANPAPSSSAESIATAVAQAWSTSFGPDDVYDPNDPASLWTRLSAAGLTEIGPDNPQLDSFANLAAQLDKLTVPPAFTLPPGQLLRDHLFDALVGTTYLGLRYVERGAEPSPAVLDASCCGDNTCFPARIEEGVVIVAQQTTPFPRTGNPYGGAKLSLEKSFLAQENAPPPAPVGPPFSHDCRAALCDYLTGAWRGFPPAEDPCGAALPVVPIACVYWSRFPREAGSGTSRVLSVDNCTWRPLAPGVPPVRALTEVLTQGMTPTATRPRFDLIEPANHGELVVTQGATSATVRARATSTLAALPASASWEVYFYPVNASSPPSHWPASQPSGFTISVGSAPDPQDAGVTDVDLVFAATPGSTLTLPSGTYLWRLNFDNSLVALRTQAVLDGAPRPPDAVPSGGGMPAGATSTFEAMFYVR